MPRDVLCEKPQYQVTVFLKQEVFAAVTPVVFCIGKMESAVNLYGKLPLLAEKIHFHKWIGAEWNINTPIDRKQTFRLGKSVEELKEKPLGRTSRGTPITGLFQRCMDKQVRRLRICTVAPEPAYRVGIRLILA